jgi:BirA family biotin operon repressor/biotin-[acetyl-CoA-carboxylase] ligase
VPCAAAPGWRKLGGILCENRGQCPDAILSPYCVVLGIGLNLNHSAAELPAQTRTPPTSVLRETGRPCSRKEVLRATLERIEEHFIALHDSATSSALKRRFEDQLRRWWTADSLLTVQAPARGSQGGRTIRGRFSGLDAQGRLEIQDEHVRRRLFADVEVTDVRRKR